ncbi:hypothetical protein NDU88_005974 [Pleurodeles waltl]|uniref:Secreted protein n=1 Tax=Pleurodeles waltl TaxID=8319 RepID=A0AAV7WCY4_PLEWA|nr:hypothetical protein NDU88_005974 [Pleurodeles waltl]
MVMAVYRATAHVHIASTAAAQTLGSHSSERAATQGSAPKQADASLPRPASCCCWYYGICGQTGLRMAGAAWLGLADAAFFRWYR